MAIFERSVAKMGGVQQQLCQWHTRKSTGAGVITGSGSDTGFCDTSCTSKDSKTSSSSGINSKFSSLSQKDDTAGSRHPLSQSPYRRLGSGDSATAVQSSPYRRLGSGDSATAVQSSLYRRLGSCDSATAVQSSLYRRLGSGDSATAVQSSLYRRLGSGDSATAVQSSLYRRLGSGDSATAVQSSLYRRLGSGDSATAVQSSLYRRLGSGDSATAVQSSLYRRLGSGDSATAVQSSLYRRLGSGDSATAVQSSLYRRLGSCDSVTAVQSSPYRRLSSGDSVTAVQSAPHAQVASLNRSESLSHPWAGIRQPRCTGSRNCNGTYSSVNTLLSDDDSYSPSTSASSPFFFLGQQQFPSSPHVHYHHRRKVEAEVAKAVRHEDENAQHRERGCCHCDDSTVPLLAAQRSALPGTDPQPYPSPSLNLWGLSLGAPPPQPSPQPPSQVHPKHKRGHTQILYHGSRALSSGSGSKYEEGAHTSTRNHAESSRKIREVRPAVGIHVNATMYAEGSCDRDETRPMESTIGSTSLFPQSARSNSTATTTSTNSSTSSSVSYTDPFRGANAVGGERAWAAMWGTDGPPPGSIAAGSANHHARVNIASSGFPFDAFRTGSDSDSESGSDSVSSCSKLETESLLNMCILRSEEREDTEFNWWGDTEENDEVEKVLCPSSRSGAGTGAGSEAAVRGGEGEVGKVLCPSSRSGAGTGAGSEAAVWRGEGAYPSFHPNTLPSYSLMQSGSPRHEDEAEQRVEVECKCQFQWQKSKQHYQYYQHNRQQAPAAPAPAPATAAAQRR